MNEKIPNQEDLNIEIKILRDRITELEKTAAAFQQLTEELRASEERYRRIVASISSYFYSVRVEGGKPIETVHGDACYAVTGYTPAEYAASPMLWIAMVPEEDRQAVLTQAESILAGQPSYPIEHRITHRDGEVRWMRNTPVAHYDATGTLVSYDGIIEDITKRKQAELARQQAEALYQSLVENLPIRIFRKDLEGRFVYANLAFCSALGMTVSELVGKTDFDIFPQGLAWKYRRDDTAVMKTGVPFHGIEEYEDVMGARRSVEVLKTPVRDDSGDLIGLQGTFWDVGAYQSTEGVVNGMMEIASSRNTDREDDVRQSNERLRLELMDWQRSERQHRDREICFRTLLDAAREPMIICDRLGQIQYLNLQATYYFGKNTNLIIGQTFWETMNDEEARRWRESFEQAVQSGRTVQYDDEFNDQKILVRLQPVLGLQGIVEACGIIVSITPTIGLATP